jgi:hypothetical protein
MGSGLWAYQKVGRDDKAHLLEQPMTSSELRALSVPPTGHEPPSSRQPRPEQLHEPGKHIQAKCATCGTSNPLKYKFCGQCGASLESARLLREVARPQQPRPAPAPKPATRVEEIEQSKSRFSATVNSLLFGSVVIGVLLILFCIFTIATAPNEDKRTSIAATRTAAPTATPTMTINELKATAKTLSYDELARNTEQYEGELLYFYGRVAQVMEKYGDKADLRVYVSVGGGKWSNDPILVRYEGPRLLEDDLIHLWGTVNGRVTYETIMGAKVTVPDLTAVILTRVE